MADPQRFDSILKTLIVVVLVAILSIGGWFGYTIYRDKLIAEDSTPALRIMKVIKAQVDKNPNDPVLRIRLGEALGAAGRPQQAIEQFNAALKIDPKHTGAYLDLGILAMTQNRLDEARAYFKKVVDLTTGTEMSGGSDRRETAFYNLGLLEMRAKNYDAAVGNFKESLRIKNDASDTYFYMAEALQALGQDGDAITNLALALKFDPSFAQAHYQLAKLYLAQGDKVRASAEIGLAMQFAPAAPEPKKVAVQIGDPAAYLKTAQAQAASDPQAALEAVTIAYNLDHTNVTAGKLEGKLLVQLGKKKTALIVYQKLATTAPGDAEIKAAIKSLTHRTKKNATPTTSKG